MAKSLIVPGTEWMQRYPSAPGSKAMGVKVYEVAAIGDRVGYKVSRDDEYRLTRSAYHVLKGSRKYVYVCR